jgi:hypothetical protein
MKLGDDHGVFCEGQVVELFLSCQSDVDLDSVWFWTWFARESEARDTVNEHDKERV